MVSLRTHAIRVKACEQQGRWYDPTTSTTFEAKDNPSSEIINASFGVSTEGGVKVSAYANNLLDERVIQKRRVIGPLEAVTVNRPRTVGVRVSYQF